MTKFYEIELIFNALSHNKARYGVLMGIKTCIKMINYKYLISIPFIIIRQCTEILVNISILTRFSLILKMKEGRVMGNLNTKEVKNGMRVIS